MQAPEWALDGGTCFCDSCGAHYQCKRCDRWVHQQYDSHNTTHSYQDGNKEIEACEMTASEKKNASRTWHWDGRLEELVTDDDDDDDGDMETDGFRAKLTGIY